MALKLVLIVYWILFAAVLTGESYWAYRALIYPRLAISSTLGTPVSLAPVVGYSNEASIRGGTIFWNLQLSQSEAQALRTRCSGGGNVLPLHERIDVIRPEDAAAAPSREASPPKSNACLLAKVDSPGGSSGYVVVLGDDDILQLTQWID